LKRLIFYLNVPKRYLFIDLIVRTRFSRVDQLIEDVVVINNQTAKHTFNKIKNNLFSIYEM